MTTPDDRVTEEQLNAAREIIREYDRARVSGKVLGMINIDDVFNALDEKLPTKFTTPSMWRGLALIGELWGDPDISVHADDSDHSGWILFTWCGKDEEDPEFTP
jgi:hypothetical protein